MKLRKLIAGTLVATMIVGSSMAAFADDANSGDPANGATGKGESVGHVNKEIKNVTLPTNGQVDGIFDYYVDPERLVEDAVVASGDADAIEIDPAAQGKGVYFKKSDGKYSNESEPANFEGKNSVDVDVSVTAKVTAGAQDIELVTDSSALSDAKGPALLMNLVVGGTSTPITSAGATAKVTLAGKEENFEVRASGLDYTYEIKDSGLAAWDSTTVKLSGETNNEEVPEGMTAPTIELTWTVGGPQVTMTNDGTITMSGLIPGANYAHSAILVYGDLSDELDSDPNMTWNTNDWTEENGGTLIFKLSQAWLNALSGKSATVTVKLTNNETITATCQF